MEKKFRFKTNMGVCDRMARLCAGFGLILVGSLVVQGTMGTIILVIGTLAVLTAAIGFCPGYVPFGISTAGFPFARSERMSKMMTQCCRNASPFSSCCGIVEPTRGKSGDTQDGLEREESGSRNGNRERAAQSTMEA